METSDLEKQTDSLASIVFDTSSGISLEEQQEILEGINSMMADSLGNTRMSPDADLLQEQSSSLQNIKKKDYYFPLSVNIGAVLVLGLGILLLSMFNRHDVQEIRESSATLGITERMLIQEIRQETNRLISEKENQINDILSRLSFANAEYILLSESVESLTEAQMERAAYLLQVQEEYRQTLSWLHEERAGILEDSRQREMALRLYAEQSLVELSAAMEELRRLGTEQERAARVESQMSGFYATLNSQINSGSLDDAANTLNSMREFLAAPSFLGSAILQTRKQSHLAAISALEEVVGRLSPEIITVGVDQEFEEILAELRTRNAALERDIAAFGAQGSDREMIIAEYQAVISRLEADRLDQQQTLYRLNSEVEAAATRVSQSENALAEQRAEYAALSQERETLRRQNDELQRQIEAVRALLLE